MTSHRRSFAVPLTTQQLRAMASSKSERSASRGKLKRKKQKQDKESNTARSTANATKKKRILTVTKKRPRYYIDGEKRSQCRGVQAGFLAKGPMQMILLCYIAASYYMYNKTELFSALFVRGFLLITLFSSIYYSDLLHNLDQKPQLHNTATYLAKYELHLLKWDIFWIQMIIHSMSYYLRLICGNSVLLDHQLISTWKVSTLLIAMEISLSCIISYLLFQIQFIRVIDDDKEWLKVKQQRLLQGIGRTVTNKSMEPIQLFMGISFLSTFLTWYVTDNSMNLRWILLLQTVGFIFFKGKTDNSGNNKLGIGGHEVFHFFTHGSWLVLLVSDLLVSWQQ